MPSFVRFEFWSLRCQIFKTLVSACPYLTVNTQKSVNYHRVTKLQKPKPHFYREKNNVFKGIFWGRLMNSVPVSQSQRPYRVDYFMIASLHNSILNRIQSGTQLRLNVQRNFLRQINSVILFHKNSRPWCAL